MNTDAAELRRYFLGWQCRIRQLCMREEGGRPLPGMRPYVSFDDLAEPAQITTGMLKSEPADATARFKHIVRKTPDTAQRYEGAVRMLSAHYYQHPDTFADELTALFSLDSRFSKGLLARGSCVLEFEHGAQRFQLPSGVRRLPPGSAGYEATYWHNLLFNPTLPAAVSIVGFQPDWEAARAQPPVT